MPSPGARYHERISLERYDEAYSDVAEADYNHHDITSPFDAWSASKLRSKCDMAGARNIPTDIVIWGRGNGPHPATTRIGGVPAWPSGKKLPEGLKFFGQFNPLDSADILSLKPKGLLSVWVSEEFPFENGSVKTFLVDADAAVPSLNFGAGHRFAEEGHEPYFGSLCRSWDPDPKHEFQPAEVDHQLESYRKYVPRSWNATKYGGLEAMPQWGTKPGFWWRYLFQFTSIQPCPKVPWPWTTQEEPLSLGFGEDGIYHDRNAVVLGDMGAISFSISRTGSIKTLFECG